THIVEPALVDAKGELVAEGVLDLPYRTDFVKLETGEPAMFAPEKSVGFEPFSFSVGGTAIAVAPFPWDYAAIRVTGDWDEIASRTLRNWFLKAFGEDHGAGNLALQHAVHYVSDPEISASGYSFITDLGTAPAATLHNLLLALLGTAPHRIEIGMPPQ
ncbi:MAG: hypothetical protein WAU86_19970, partial [Oricola sp.]